MIEYATITSGSVLGYFTESLNNLTHWLDGVPTYWVIGGLILFFLLLRFFVKKVF